MARPSVTARLPPIITQRQAPTQATMRGSTLSDQAQSLSAPLTLSHVGESSSSGPHSLDGIPPLHKVATTASQLALPVGSMTGGDTGMATGESYHMGPTSSTSHSAMTLHRTTDKEVGYHYVELPSDTLFVESVAHNDQWKEGVGYVPVLRLVNSVKETHIYEISPGMTEAKHLGGPMKLTTSGTFDVTVYGSHLTSTGILYLTFWNNNCISWINLRDLPADRGAVMTNRIEIPVAAPNDVCVDPEDEDILYIAGGTAHKGCCGFVNAARGKVYKVVVSRDHTTYDITCVAEGLDVLAGIEVCGKDILVAQLYDAIAIDKQTHKKKVVWSMEQDGRVWLADNVAMFDEKRVIAPAFNTVSPGVRDMVLKRPCCNTVAVFFLQIYSAIVEGEGLGAGLWDPEVSLAVAHTYATEKSIPHPVRISIFDSIGSDIHNFEIDMVETRETGLREVMDIEFPPHKVLGKRWRFDEQVTHCTRMQMPDRSGFLVCVNFQQPRILMLNDTFFRRAVGARVVA